MSAQENVAANPEKIPILGYKIKVAAEKVGYSPRQFARLIQEYQIPTFLVPIVRGSHPGRHTELRVSHANLELFRKKDAEVIAAGIVHKTHANAYHV